MQVLWGTKKKKKFSCFFSPVIYLLRRLFFFFYLFYCTAILNFWVQCVSLGPLRIFVFVSIKTCLWWISGSLSLFTLKGMAWSTPCCYSTINGICPGKGLEGLQYHSEPMLRAKMGGEAFFPPPLQSIPCPYSATWLNTKHVQHAVNMLCLKWLWLLVAEPLPWWNEFISGVKGTVQTDGIAVPQALHQVRAAN